MNTKAKAYLGLFMAMGAAILTLALTRFAPADTLRFITFLLIASATSGLKVNLPGIHGTLSVNSVFIFFSLIELSFSETVAIAALSAIVQTIWSARVRAKWFEVAFNVGSVTSAAALSFLTFSMWPKSRPMLLAMAVAACVYFFSNTFSIAGIIALTGDKNARQVWKECYFWSFPYYLIAASIAVTMWAAAKYFGWEVGLGVLPLLFLVYRSYSLYLRNLEEEKTHAQGLASLHLRTIEALALAIEAKDQTTGHHLERTQVYAREMAKTLALSEQETLALQAAAILHDIGKLAVPDYIISKPGKLTPEEFEKMKIHPTVGAEILERIDFPYPVVPIVRAHHEKWDGSGYPAGLRGEEIPMGARILAAIDCLDALASDRQYRKALPLEEAMGAVSKESGKAFDPRVVEILEQRYREIEKLTRKESQKIEPELSLELKVERGVSPDAGFEVTDPAGSNNRPGFLASIASARQEAQSLYEFTQALGSTLSLAETLSMVAARVKSLVDYDAIVISIREGDVLVPKHVSGENQKLFESLRVPAGEGLSGWVADNRKSILNGNPSVEPGYLHDPTRFSTLASALAVPLETEGGMAGVLAIYRKSKDAFSRDDLRLLLAISSKISVSIENALSYQAASSRAAIDGLTGLPNASALFVHLENELSRASRTGTTVTILVCDLDGFKQVNDQHGHLAGNCVLQNIAQNFRKRCRSHEYVARMGGDEFVMVLGEIQSQAVGAVVEEFVSLARRAGAEVCGSDVLSASIGVAVYPEDGDTTESLLNEADRRMYRQKRANKRSENSSVAQGFAPAEQALTENVASH